MKDIGLLGVSDGEVEARGLGAREVWHEDVRRARRAAGEERGSLAFCGDAGQREEMQESLA